MNRNIKKLLAAGLCCAILIVGIGASVLAITSGKDQKKTEEKPVVMAAENDADFVKDETVYVLTGADGSVDKIIVSDWIKNSVGSNSFSDKSELTNVENVKGDQTYTMNGDHMRVWDAQGNDIYYQGNIEKELPVILSVSYKLDGKNISFSELAGKSGKVTIRFDYTNNQYETVEIDGKQEKINVPFAMLTGMILDNDVFSNVEVSNGKLLNDGDHTVIAGIAFPGLQSNLNLDADKLKIPDYVEITADVKNFEMANTVTIATNEIFSNINTEELNSIDDLTDSLDEMTDAMDQLIDGSSNLYDGLCTLLDKSDELISGINQLSDGALKLKNGTHDLSDGTAELVNGATELSDGTSSLLDGAKELVNGAKTLAGGLETLTTNNDTLNNGAKQVFESLLSMADEQLAATGLSVPKLTIQNYAQVLNEVIASLDQDHIAKQAQEIARQTVTEMVNAQKDVIRATVAAKVQEEVAAQVTEAVRTNVESQVLAAMGMSKEEYEASVKAGMVTAEQQAQVTAAINAQMAIETVQTTISATINAQMQSDNIQAMITAKTEEQIPLLIEQNMNSPEVQAQITSALEQAKSGATAISALKEQLDSYHQFYIGLGQYTAGVASAKDGANQLYIGADQLKSGAKQVNDGSNQLKDGANTLKGGAAELYAGMSELYDGILTLKDGVPALIDGVTQLRDGAMLLSDGLKEFSKEGIQKLVDAVDGDMNSLITRFKSTVDVSKNFKSFSGISDDMDGQVKFIYRTDAIEIK
jgi:X-X-X-leu-X-X-gly heptad repeats